MSSIRLRLIKKLIPDYRTKEGQDLAMKLFHWITPHIEHAGYRWSIKSGTNSVGGEREITLTTTNLEELKKAYPKGKYAKDN